MGFRALLLVVLFLTAPVSCSFSLRSSSSTHADISVSTCEQPLCYVKGTLKFTADTTKKDQEAVESALKLDPNLKTKQDQDDVLTYIKDSDTGKVETQQKPGTDDQQRKKLIQGFSQTFLDDFSVKTSISDLAARSKLLAAARAAASSKEFFNLCGKAKVDFVYGVRLTRDAMNNVFPIIQIFVKEKTDVEKFDADIKKAILAQVQKTSKSTIIDVLVGGGDDSKDRTVSTRIRTFGRTKEQATAGLEHVVGQIIAIALPQHDGSQIVHRSTIAACFSKQHWSHMFRRRDFLLTTFHQHAAKGDATHGSATMESDLTSPTGQVTWTAMPRGFNLKNYQSADATTIQLNWWHTCRCQGNNIFSMTTRFGTLDDFGTFLEELGKQGKTLPVEYVGFLNQGTGVIEPSKPSHNDFLLEDINNIWLRVTKLTGALQNGDSGGAVYVTHNNNRYLLGIIKGDGVDHDSTRNPVMRVTPIWNIPIPAHYSIC